MLSVRHAGMVAVAMSAAASLTVTACASEAPAPATTAPRAVAPTIVASTTATPATEPRAAPASDGYNWPSHVWFGDPSVGRDQFVDGELAELFGTPGVALGAVSVPERDDPGYRYSNPLGESVPFLVRAPGGDPFTGDLHAAPVGAGLVIALHQTNEVGGSEPCGEAGAPLSYGTAFAEAGSLVVCPTLSFTGERQPDAPWDTADFYASYPDWSALAKDVIEVSWLLDALDAARVPLVDVMVVGHSQGAIYGLYAGALDERIDRVVANAGFVDTALDPDPGRWSRDAWYRAFRSAPAGLDLLEVVAAIAPRCALLVNYDADAILVATEPDPSALVDFEQRFPSIDWLAARGPHDWPADQLASALDWAGHTEEACT